MTAGQRRLSGSVAVVTGGASGIGEAIVRLVVAEGGCAVIADRQRAQGEALAAHLGDAAVFQPTDVSIEADVAAMVDAAVTRFGHLDILCNNAGLVGSDRPITDTTTADYADLMDVLVLGAFLGTKHAARVMIGAGRGGAIVNTSSIAGLTGGLGPLLYTTAKHAILGMTKAAAAELAPYRIRVNAVAPGGVPTPMAARMIAGDPTQVAAIADRIAGKSPLGRSSTPDDIAEAVAYLVSPAGSYVTGQTLVVDAGQTIGAPRVPPPA